MEQRSITLPKDTTPRVLVGDVRKQLQRIPKGSIHCVVTSPPYWQQRDYEVKGQIGVEKTCEEYIKNIADVGDKLKEVLVDDGSYFLNIGDKYQEKNLRMIPSRVAEEMQNRGWILRNIIVWYKPNHVPSPVKDRLGNTWEPIFFFVKGTGKYTTPEYYFNLDEIRVPHKTNEDRKFGLEEILANEEIKKLSSRIRKTGKLPQSITEEEYGKLPEKLKERKNEKYNGKFKNTKRKNLGASPGARMSVQGTYYSGPHRKHNPNELEVIEYLRERKKERGLTISDISKRTRIKKTTVEHWFRTDRGGRCLPDPKSWVKLKEALDFDGKYDKEMTEIHYTLQDVRRNPKGKNPGDAWEMKTGTLPQAHFSIFPEELPKRVIKSCVPSDGIVLDPFGGSGTTAKVAKDLGKKSIVIELNEDYIDIIAARCGKIVVVDENGKEKIKKA